MDGVYWAKGGPTVKGPRRKEAYVGFEN